MSEKTLKQIKDEAIFERLEKCNYNLAKTALSLGVASRFLYDWRKQLGVLSTAELREIRKSELSQKRRIKELNKLSNRKR